MVTLRDGLEGRVPGAVLDPQGVDLRGPVAVELPQAEVVVGCRPHGAAREVDDDHRHRHRHHVGQAYRSP